MKKTKLFFDEKTKQLLMKKQNCFLMKKITNRFLIKKNQTVFDEKKIVNTLFNYILLFL